MGQHMAMVKTGNDIDRTIQQPANLRNGNVGLGMSDRDILVLLIIHLIHHSIGAEPAPTTLIFID
jgi:hypothetical protein